MEYTYLLINFFTIIIPFIFSFHPKLQFYKTWNAFFPAVILTGALFIIWDIYFTYLGVWGFNEKYLTGIFFFGLPIEEILFFFCIPYACIFTFHCLDLFIDRTFSKRTEKILSLSFIFLFLLISAFNSEKIYTVTTFASLAILLLISRYLIKAEWLLKFYIIYGVLLLPFFIVNGVLTGTGLEEPIVWYNPEEFMGIRLMTIPLEDVFYGMELILLNLLFYKFLLNRKVTPKMKNV